MQRTMFTTGSLFTHATSTWLKCNGSPPLRKPVAPGIVPSFSVFLSELLGTVVKEDEEDNIALVEVTCKKFFQVRVHTVSRKMIRVPKLSTTGC